MSPRTEKIFKKPEDFIGTWTLRDGSKIIISSNHYWDSNGDFPGDPQKDLMEREREAKL